MKYNLCCVIPRGKIWRSSWRKPLTTCGLQQLRTDGRCTSTPTRSRGSANSAETGGCTVFQPSSSRVKCRNALTDVCFSCRSRHEEYDLVGGDHLGCHFTSILQSTGLQYRDFIHISFHNQVTSRGLAPRVQCVSERLQLCLLLCRSTRSRFSWR